ncbi:MAG: FecR domain-containing protein [Verrucomicrobia bacterium]|nr:FecR domain-containing protein [Verrucomicrobiota bacterium]
MMRPNTSSIILQTAAWLSLTILITLPTEAAPLKSARVTDAHNEVILAKSTGEKREATVNDAVSGSDVIQTGKKSRAEIEFLDKSITRLGSNTLFNFDPQSREMKLDSGIALIYVPPGTDGTRIVTPSGICVIHGGDVVTIRVAREKTQIVALSHDDGGEITVSHVRTKEMRQLQAGQMLSVATSAATLPEPVYIDIEAFVRSSMLLRGVNTGSHASVPESGSKPEKEKLKNPEKKESSDEMVSEKNMQFFGSAASFRKVACSDIKGAFRQYASGRDTFNVITERDLFKKAPEVWQYFFGGSTLLVSHINAEISRTAFYNPYLDAAVVQDWERKTNKTINCRVITGSSLLKRGSVPELRPHWLEEEMPELSLVDNSKKFIEAFGAKNPFSSAANPAVLKLDEESEMRIIEQRLAGAIVNLTGAIDKKGKDSWREPLKGFLNVIAGSQSDKLAAAIPQDNPMSVKQIFSIPAIMRKNFQPVYVLQNGTHISIFLQVESIPTYFATICFEKANRNIRKFVCLNLTGR